MNKLSMETVRSQKELWSVLGLSVLAIAPFLIALIAIAKFAELSDPVALDHAQVARHVMQGDGFSTSLLRPLSVAIGPKSLPHPDLVNAPAHPALLAAVYRVMGASDRTVAAVGLGLWLVTAWLTFALARHWWGLRAAVLATVFYTCSAAALATAASGLPSPLLAIFLLLAIWAAVPAGGSGATTAGDLPGWQLVGAGLLAGGAVLTEYGMLAFAVVLAVFVARTAARKGRAAGLFAAGLLPVLLPWMIRNWIASDEGGLGLYSYGALTGTREFPGESVWRSVAITEHPLLYLLLHPLDLVRKLAAGLMQYRSVAAGTVDPVVALLFVVALFSAGAASRRGRVARLVTASIVLAALWSCLFQPNPRWLVAWVPLLAGVAGAQFVVWSENRVGEFRVRQWRVQSVLSRGLVQAGVILLVAVPMAIHLVRIRYVANPQAEATAAAVNKLLPKDGLIMTDRPAETAWRLNRPAVGLCQSEDDLTVLTKWLGPISALQVSPEIGMLREGERGEWWVWAASPRGIYRGLSPVANYPVPGMLRVARKPVLAEAQANQRLEELQAAVKADPKSAEAHSQLAQGYLTVGRLREAQQEFLEAIRRDEQQVEPLLGLWQTVAQLTQTEGTLRVAQMVGQLSPRAPQAKELLEQAATHFDQALQRTPEPWLLLNAIACRSKLGQWTEVEGYYARLAGALPKAFPSALLLANLYLQQGETEKATAACEQLIRENPKLAMAHQLAGRIHMATGSPELALSDFRMVVQLRPEWAAGHVQLAQACQKLKRYDEAVQHLKTALKLAPGAVNLQLSLADIYLAQEKTAEAITVYSSILSTSPQQVVALNNLAELLARTGKATEALVLTRQAIELQPQHPLVRDTTGWVAFQAGHPEEALLHLSEAVRLAPKHGISHYHLAKVFMAQQRRAEATQALKQALEFGLPPNEKLDAEKLLAAANQ